MGAPIDQRLEKLLALSDKRGMVVEAVQVRGNEILITYATSEDAVYRALEAVQRDKVISGRPQVIRIEKN